MLTKQEINEKLREGGFIQGMEVAIAPPGRLAIFEGDIIRMTVSFEYKGQAQTVMLRCSIGLRTFGIFDERVWARGTIDLPASADFESYSYWLDINTAGLVSMLDGPDALYDIEAKIEEFDNETLTKHDDVIEVLKPAEFREFKITDYLKR